MSSCQNRSVWGRLMGRSRGSCALFCYQMYESSAKHLVTGLGPLGQELGSKAGSVLKEREANEDSSDPPPLTLLHRTTVNRREMAAAFLPPSKSVSNSSFAKSNLEPSKEWDLGKCNPV